VQLDAHSAVINLLELLYISLPFGIATTATIRVGNLLGAGRPREARIAGDRSGGLPIHPLGSSCTAGVAALRPVSGIINA
jgi:hypothetical protein